jgi:plasmid replication initiation protein
MSEEIEVLDASSERYVNVKNELVRRTQKMSLPVKRLLALAIAMCDSKQKILLHEAQQPGKDGAELQGWAIKISAEQYAEHYPQIGRDAAYAEMKSSASALMKCTVNMVERQRQRGKIIEVPIEIPFTTQNDYPPGQGHVVIRFHGKIAPYLLGLEREFTQYKLSSAARLRSMYSWRLLELLAQFQKTGLVLIGYDEFCDALGVPESCRKDFAQLRRRVIEPAVKELKEKNGIEVEAKGTKPGGRKITGLEFKFAPSKQGALF